MPEHIWPEFKVRARLAYQAPSRGIARELAAGVVTHYGRKHDQECRAQVDLQTKNAIDATQVKIPSSPRT